MRRTATPGTCASCAQTFSKAAIVKHLDSCERRPTGSQRALAIEVSGGPDYWIYIEADAAATFGHLDGFLRRLWLECCGHMSAFRLPDGEPARGAKLANLLRPGFKFRYEYDFGSTTELSLRVLGERAGPDGKVRIRLLARNEPPAIPCGQCDGSAESVCGECGCEPGGWLCKKCARTHECGEEMLLPVVNSPRAGVCGYTGG